MYSENDTVLHKLQVHTVDQTVHHQGNQSVFFGGRPWTLLPAPALLRRRKYRAPSAQNQSVHTHPSSGGMRYNNLSGGFSEQRHVAPALVCYGTCGMAEAKHSNPLPLHVACCLHVRHASKYLHDSHTVCRLFANGRRPQLLRPPIMTWERRTSRMSMRRLRPYPLLLWYSELVDFHDCGRSPVGIRSGPGHSCGETCFDSELVCLGLCHETWNPQLCSLGATCS